MDSNLLQSFNTASGITQLQHKPTHYATGTVKPGFQYRKRYYPVATQASGNADLFELIIPFQYRKR